MVLCMNDFIMIDLMILFLFKSLDLNFFYLKIKIFIDIVKMHY